mgnify:FL=1
MGEEFYSIIKLVSGEEVFALVCVDESEDEPILILHHPIMMKPLSPLGTINYVKVTPWMEMSDEDMFVLRMDKVITMTECKDKKLINIYKQYVEESEEGGLGVFKPTDNKVKLNSQLGLLSSVEKKRESLEQLFKENTKDSKYPFQPLQC